MDSNEKYVLCVEKNTLTPTNDISQVFFQSVNHAWEVVFQNNVVKMHTFNYIGECCTLHGRLVEIDCQEEFNDKKIKVVYEMSKLSNGCPYGGKLVIFDDMTFFWMFYGSVWKYDHVGFGHVKSKYSWAVRSV